MKLFLICNILFVLVAFCVADEKKRINLQKLSDKEPGSKDYDHEAFLGEEVAKTFDELKPDESARRLGIIFDKIDTDHDAIIHEKELEKWIEKAQKRHVEDDTNEQFAKYDTNKDGLVHWDEFYKITFGGLKSDEDWKVGESQGFSYKDMLKRDRKRWEAADTSKDDSCTISELSSFLHPQDVPHMKDIVFEETMTDVDRNGDGFLDLEEYINDVYKPGIKGEPEPDWVATEREQFVIQRDTDKDGRLNEAEVRQWIMPEDYNYALAEAKHLIYESDTNQDGVLTKKEATDHYEVFVGSQATQWGKIFDKHDEF